MMAQLSFLREIPTEGLLSLPQHREALARLKYIIASKGFGVMTGSPGMGKSSILRTLDASLDKSRFLFCYINDADLKPKNLYSKIPYYLSVQPSTYLDRMKKQFRDAVVNLYDTHDRLPIIVIDNAQDLPIQTIKEIRYLLNFEIDAKSLLSLILVGHPELRDTLKLRSFEAVSQCITAHYRLSPLDEKQTYEYISHHLNLSQLKMLFPEDVVNRIHQFTSGIPRVINQICRHCLIDMESNQLELADHQVLERVLSEFQY
ncbi:ExeA family protein [Dehalobacterium formicoaceticum]|uniref:ExeA family protein n=1 Tax=Dehalobacterium formicoaceticum TaxID=51515 RepID=UPI0031F6CF01